MAVETFTERTEALAQRGRAAAALLLDSDDPIEPIEEFDPIFARTALDEIEARQEGKLRGLPRKIIRGANRSARNLRADAAHGLVEVIQNADDEEASEVRIAVRPDNSELLIAHDGGRVRLDHVLGMVFPFVTTKLDDADTIGRFGIGLKTLLALGGPLTVHCSPFHFEILEAGLRHVDSPGAISHFWNEDGAHPHTLLRLRLNPRFGADFFADWLRRWDASHLVFLRHVRQVKLVDLSSGAAVVRHALRPGRRETVDLDVFGARARAERIRLSDLDGSRSWTRYTVERPTVPGIVRADKETGNETPLSVAIPTRPAHGRLYAGLPFEEPCRLPFSLGAHFDPDGNRTSITDSGWNSWLFDGLADVIGAVALQRFGEAPRSGWAAVPCTSESAGQPNGWVSERALNLIRAVQHRIKEDLVFDAGEGGVRFSALAYEAEPLDRSTPLLSPADIAALAPGREALITDWRDRHGRWRKVALDLGLSEITVNAALGLLSWPTERLGDRPPQWFVDLAAAGIGLDARSYHLRTGAWVVTDAGTRLSPSRIARDDLVVVRRAHPHALAERIGVARVLHRAFSARTDAARAAAKWLDERGFLKRTPTNADALRALAAWGSTDGPLDLTRDDNLLLELRDALDDLKPDERHQLGPRIGQNVIVRGHRFVHGKEQRIPVRPAGAYLPRSIDTTPEDGFPAVAKRAPRLLWVEPRYIELVKGGDERGSARRPVHKSRREQRSGARAFFGLLGAAVTPRLISVAPDIPRYSDAASRLPQPLCAEHHEELTRRRVANAYLKDDWDSPDLIAVIQDIMRERKLADRRARARGLIVTMSRPRNWEEL